MEKHLNVPANTEELAELKIWRLCIFDRNDLYRLEMRHIKECMKRC